MSEPHPEAREAHVSPVSSASTRTAPADEPHRTSRLALAGFAAGALALLVMAVGGPGTRAGFWDFRTGFSLLRWGGMLGLGAMAVALAGMVRARPGSGRRGLSLAALGFLLGLLAFLIPWAWRESAAGAPPIHDITTDLQDPPLFQAILPLRADAPNPAEYGGPEVAEQQRAAYPDLRTLDLAIPPAEAFDRALRAARDMGWEVVAAEPEAGRLEAVATTLWFGFEDDVVVRIRGEEGGGSQVDARSVSRVGRGDLGTNAERIRDFLERIGDVDAGR